MSILPVSVAGCDCGVITPGSDLGTNKSSGLKSSLLGSFAEVGVAKIWSGRVAEVPSRLLLEAVSSWTGVPLCRPVTGSIVCSPLSA